MGCNFCKKSVCFFTSANLIKSATGSDPEDNTKINGVKIVESLKHFPRSNVGDIIYSFPNWLHIQFLIAGITLK
jgi:hypothetical protein